MSSTSIPGLDKTWQVFGLPEELCEASATLRRLIKLDHALSETSPLKKRSKIQEDVKKIWQETLENRPQNDQISDHVLATKTITNIRDKYNPFLENFYSWCFSLNPSLDESVPLFIRDLKSTPTCPLVRAQRGFKGPTFLVSFSSYTASAMENHQAYVMKWTGWNEICSNKIYAFFSCYEKDISCGFLVPPSIGIDFEKHLHQSSDGKLTILSSDDCSTIRENFIDVTEIHNLNRVSIENKQLMLSKRIQGANLIDFIITQYSDLSKLEKEKIFKRFGRLALLDVILGNLDRIVQIDRKEGKYDLRHMEVNLGNVMIRSSVDQPPKVYAIDNELDSHLIFSDSDRKSYLHFLQNLFSSKDRGSSALMQSIIPSFISALHSQVDDLEGNLTEARKKLKVFEEDLLIVGEESIRQGIKEMDLWLQNTLIPNWEADQTNALKQSIIDVLPELFSAIDERIKLFQQLKEIQ
jgi:hypothetical protein